MPPKKGQDKPKSAKVVVDKTFGLKNKKGGAAKAAIKVAQQQQAQVGKSKAAVEKEKEREAAKAKKLAEQKKKEEDAALYGAVETIVQPKVPFGADPKSFVCAFFKAGKCTKGRNCKFSHDLGVERKTTKASIYADQRDEKGGNEDTMDKWSDEKLREVIDQHGKRQTNATDIVCKFFIEAVENSTFGYFWQCPNGDDCKYRHALPPGFVLKSQKKREEEEAKKSEITLDQFLDVERHKLDQSKLTPVTPESFKEWKEKRLSKKEAEEKAVQATKSATAAAGKAVGLSGRDLFTYNPEMYGDSDDEDGGVDNEWDLEVLRAQAQLRERAGDREIERMQDQLDGTSINGDDDGESK